MRCRNGPPAIHSAFSAPDVLGIIRTPERVTNIAWGDDDLCTLYPARVKVPGRLTY